MTADQPWVMCVQRESIYLPWMFDVHHSSINNVTWMFDIGMDDEICHER